MDDLEIDVRPILSSGGQPFGAVMEALGRLREGQGLRLLSPFKPLPLFTVMAAKGFAGEAEPLENGDWVVVFRPAGTHAGTPSPEDWPVPSYYLDCTDPEAPEAGSRIRSRLATMSEGEVLFALLEEEPAALYAELLAAGHQWVGDFDASGDNYRIMIRAGRPST